MTHILTSHEVAELLRLQPVQVDELLEQGELPSFAIFGERRVSLEEVERFVARQTAAASLKTLSNRAVQMNAMAVTLAEDGQLREALEGLEGLDAAPGTFGDLLKKSAAMESNGSKGSQGNVVAFASRMSQKGD